MPGESVSNALELRDVFCVRNGVRLGPVDVSVPAHQVTVLRGKNGSGKELLLRIFGMLEEADEGEIIVGDQSTRELDESALAELRRSYFGYLFAAPFLLPAFTAIENIVMPIFKILDADPADARRSAEELLEFVGVSQVEQERAGDLPLFEQRCVALARALATQPSVLLVEDLDSELSSEQQRHFVRLLHETCQRWKTTVIATVSPAWTPAPGDHVFEVAAGRIKMVPSPLLPS